MTDRFPPAFNISFQDALAQLPDSAALRFVELFKRGTMSIELYAPRGHDPQQPHQQDELYVVACGSGVFFDGEERRPVEPGTVLFVAAGRPHRFEDFTADFAVWVFFYGPRGGEAPGGT